MTAIGFVLIVVATAVANSPLAFMDRHGETYFAIQLVVALTFFVGLCLFTAGIAKFLWEEMP